MKTFIAALPLFLIAPSAFATSILGPLWSCSADGSKLKIEVDLGKDAAVIKDGRKVQVLKEGESDPRKKIVSFKYENEDTALTLLMNFAYLNGTLTETVDSKSKIYDLECKEIKKLTLSKHFPGESIQFPVKYECPQGTLTVEQARNNLVKGTWKTLRLVPDPTTGMVVRRAQVLELSGSIGSMVSPENGKTYRVFKLMSKGEYPNQRGFTAEINPGAKQASVAEMADGQTIYWEASCDLE
jgi:hypothetical protein